MGHNMCRYSRCDQLAGPVRATIFPGYVKLRKYCFAPFLTLSLVDRLHWVNYPDLFHGNRQWFLYTIRAGLTTKLVVVRNWLVHNNRRRYKLWIRSSRRFTEAVAVCVHICRSFNLCLRDLVFLSPKFASQRVVLESGRADRGCREASSWSNRTQ